MSVSNAYDYAGWRGATKLYVKLVDDHCFGFGRSARLIETASRFQDGEALVSGRIERAVAMASLTSYSFKGARKVSEMGVMFDITPVLSHATPVGFATIGVCLLRSITAVCRQLRFLATLSKTDRSQQNVRKDLETLGKMSIDQLENRVHCQFLKKRDITPDYLQDLAKNLDSSNLKEAKALVAKIKSQAGKKLCIHLLEIVGSLISLAGLLAAVYGMVHLAPIIIAAGIIMQIVRYMAANGWASQEKSFSLYHCIPLSIRRKLPPPLQISRA